MKQAMVTLSLLQNVTQKNKQGRLLGLLEECPNGPKGFLAMRTAHFQNVLAKRQFHSNTPTQLVETGVEANRQQILSESYCDVYTEFSATYVIETAKGLAQNATGGNKKPDHQK